MSNVLELVQSCQGAGVKISVAGEKLKIDAPRKLSQEMKEALREHKSAIIRLLTKPAIFKPHEILSRMIARGITFDVADDGFEICGEALCTDDEKRFLESNRPSILCHLQFGLLNKYLFTSSPDRLSEFLFDIEERKAILGADSLQIGFDVTARWYRHLLEDMEQTI